VQGSSRAERVVVTDGVQGPSRLRVALDATPLLGHPTGVGAFCQGALQALAERGALDVRAFAVSWRRRSLIEGLVPEGVTVAQRPMPARPLHALWGRCQFPPIEWFVGRADVVHGTNFVVPPVRGAGAVVSIHDLTPLHHPELCNEATLAYPGLIRRALQHGAWAHTDSAFVAAEVVEAFNVDPDRVVVVAPGIPPRPHVPPEVARHVVRRLLPPGTDRFILAIGTAEPRKDLPGLVRAFDDLADRHPDVALLLVGPPGWGEAALEAAIAAARAKLRIARTGWVEPTELEALLCRASVLAFPSIYEGFGFPPLQAMEAGVPVVATRAGSLPEVLADGAALVGVGDHEALADGLHQVLSDTSLRTRLIAAGAARAADFTWERCGEGLEALYRSVAGDSA
jgi:glycosyltransferase involved in cell wall biosynthesis